MSMKSLSLQLICLFLISILPESSMFEQNCTNSNFFGKYCNETMNICTLKQPCHNNGTCHPIHDDPSDFTCTCPSGFSGKTCEQDDRPCKPKNCLNGKCTETSSTKFHCQCNAGWKGIHCDEKINHCHNITCLNGGICESLLLNYTCHCVGDNYYGRHCEHQSEGLAKKKKLTVAIVCSIVGGIALIAIIGFIIKIRKYCLNIEPIEDRPNGIIQRNKPPVDPGTYRNA